MKLSQTILLGEMEGIRFRCARWYWQNIFHKFASCHSLKNGDIVLAVASLGIAATLLTGGHTAYSAFKLPLHLNATGPHDAPVRNITKNSGTAKLLQTCCLIVWDECTKSHKN